ncbi:MAG: rhodanese-like domain-containing protein [Alphaproteobacteria bacterium]|jgi:rhodanese-related sulfurtransferase
MIDSIKRITADALRACFHDGGEIALLDAREEAPFDARHLLMACCVPLGRLEALVDALVPRRDTRVVWCDNGEGLGEQAAARMAALGYGDVSLLDGGIDAWETAGHPIYSGVHVPSKAFAEVVEHEAETPYITAETLKGLIDDKEDFILFDSRSYEEYHANSIPGAISVPGAELAYRFADLTPSPDTYVVVNCGGRTRSIIGAQALINAGFPNKIVSLQNGTQAWHLGGYDVIDGATRRPSPVSEKGAESALAAAARVKEKFDIQEIDAAGLDEWRASGADKNLYILDVRTPEEYEAGHLPDARLAPGGQLVQETDVYLGAWGGRVVLVDDHGVRAMVTASWIIQMGWTDVAVHLFDPKGAGLATGPYAPRVLGDDRAVSEIDAAGLMARLDAGDICVVDLAYSNQYRNGHIPGAWFALRTELAAALAKLPQGAAVVFTSPDGALARLAAADVTDKGGAAMALKGGTDAWSDAGYRLESGATQMASAAADIRLKAREQTDDIEEAMNAYLTWEINLVHQMAEDSDHRFNVMKR